MATRMTKAEREELDAKVFACVKAGDDPYLSPVGASMREVDASLQRQRRAGKLAYDHAARKWGMGRPAAEKPARGPGRSAKPGKKPKARVRLRKAIAQVRAGTFPGAKRAKAGAK